MNYKEQLKNPKWQKKRLEIFNRDQFTCQLCMNEKNMLVVHHKKYIKGKLPWQYGNDYLITLCVDCHDKIHNVRPKVVEEPEKPLLKKLSFDWKTEPINEPKRGTVRNISIQESLDRLRKMAQSSE